MIDNSDFSIRKIKLQIQDPRNKIVTLFEDTWEEHIIEGHPEMENHLEDVKMTIENPDIIREGRKSDTELYFKANSISNIQLSGTFVATKDINGIKSIVITAYDGNNTISKGKIKWSKYENGN